MNTKEKVSNLLSVTHRLCEILARENAYFLQRHPERISASADEKVRLSKAYELLTQSLTDDPALPGEIEESERERLLSAVRKMEELAAQNAKFLKIAIETNTRLMKAVANAVKTCTPHHNSYGRDGLVSQPTARAGYGTSPLSVNQTL